MKYLLQIILMVLWMMPATAQQGQVMPVLFLNGTGAHVELPATLTDKLVNATVEGWVKWESLNKWSRVFDFGKEGNAAVLQNERETSTLFFSVWDRSGKLRRAEGFKAIDQGKWQHMAIVCGKTGMKLYVGGELVGENAYILPFNAISGGKNYLGKSNWPEDAPFHGYIADFRVWSTARSQSEIQQTMFTQLKGDEAGLAGYWRFEATEGNQSPDLTATGLHASLINGASVMNAPGPPISLVSLEPEAPPGIPSLDTHKLMLEVALADHRIDASEQALIAAVRQSGTLSAAEAEEIETGVRKDLKVGPQNAEETTYYKALESAHSDGILTSGDTDLLGKMQLAVGLSDERVAQLVQTLPKQAELEAEAEPDPEAAPAPKSTPDSYRVLVRTALMDRKIDSNEQTMLKQIAQSDNLTNDSAAEIIMTVKKELGIGPQDDPERTYFTVLKTALSDGDLSKTEEAMLQSMQSSLSLTAERVAALKQDAALLTPSKPAEQTTTQEVIEPIETPKESEPEKPPEAGK